MPFRPWARLSMGLFEAIETLMKASSRTKRGVLLLLGLALLVVTFQLQGVKLAGQISYLAVDVRLELTKDPTQHRHLWSSSCWPLVEVALCVALSLSRNRGAGWARCGDGVRGRSRHRVPAVCWLDGERGCGAHACIQGDACGGSWRSRTHGPAAKFGPESEFGDRLERDAVGLRIHKGPGHSL